MSYCNKWRSYRREIPLLSKPECDNCGLKKLVVRSIVVVFQTE